MLYEPAETNCISVIEYSKKPECSLVYVNEPASCIRQVYTKQKVFSADNGKGAKHTLPHITFATHRDNTSFG